MSLPEEQAELIYTIYIGSNDSSSDDSGSDDSGSDDSGSDDSSSDDSGEHDSVEDGSVEDNPRDEDPGEESFGEECWNKLNDSQKHFLSSLTNKENWYGVLHSYQYNDNWDILQESIESYNKCITLDDFYYLGKDMTFVNNDIDKINQLNYLKNSIINKIPNSYYHEIAKRLFINYRINEISYENAKEILVEINNMM